MFKLHVVVCHYVRGIYIFGGLELKNVLPYIKIKCSQEYKMILFRSDAQAHTSHYKFYGTQSEITEKSLRYTSIGPIYYVYVSLCYKCKPKQCTSEIACWTAGNHPELHYHYI